MERSRRTGATSSGKPLTDFTRAVLWRRARLRAFNCYLYLLGIPWSYTPHQVAKGRSILHPAVPGLLPAYARDHHDRPRGLRRIVTQNVLTFISPPRPPRSPGTPPRCVAAALPLARRWDTAAISATIFFARSRYSGTSTSCCSSTSSFCSHSTASRVSPRLLATDAWVLRSSAIVCCASTTRAPDVSINRDALRDAHRGSVPSARGGGR